MGASEAIIGVSGDGGGCANCLTSVSFFVTPHSLCVCRLYVHSAQALRSAAATRPVVGGSDDVVTSPGRQPPGK